MINHDGLRLNREPQRFPPGTVLRPLRDQIVVKPLPWTPSTTIEIAADKRAPMRGVVVFAGPGQRVKRYWKNAQGQKTKVGETGQVIRTEVKPGDVVELGGLELDGYQFTQILIGHELHIVCQEQDVCFVREPWSSRREELLMDACNQAAKKLSAAGLLP
jgi:co-chaperonin GroES (HSP10)